MRADCDAQAELFAIAEKLARVAAGRGNNLLRRSMVSARQTEACMERYLKPPASAWEMS